MKKITVFIEGDAKELVLDQSVKITNESAFL